MTNIMQFVRFVISSLRTPTSQLFLPIKIQKTKNFNAKKLTTHIQSFLKTQKETGTLQDKVSKAEAFLVSFIAEHQMPFKQVDHLMQTFKTNVS